MAVLPIVSLCTGSGGLEEGLRQAGLETLPVLVVEGETYAAAYLATEMEKGRLAPAPIWSDVDTVPKGVLKTIRGMAGLGVVAGFSCQPWSAAGQRLGTEDERWLWPGIDRIVRAARPEWVFFENVPGLVRGGLEHVLWTLADLGFVAEWGCLRAEDVAAPHRRERIFILGLAVGSRGVPDALRHALRQQPERRRRAARPADARNALARDVGEEELDNAAELGAQLGESPLSSGDRKNNRVPRPAGEELVDTNSEGPQGSRHAGSPRLSVAGRPDEELAVAQRGRLAPLGAPHDRDGSDASGDVDDGCGAPVGHADGDDGREVLGRKQERRLSSLPDEELANPDGIGERGEEQETLSEPRGESREVSGRRGDESVAEPDGVEHDRDRWRERGRSEPADGRSRFPPRSDDDWTGIPMHLWPALTADEESQLEVRELAHGMGLGRRGTRLYPLNRVDMMRMIGNGVVPLQVATAFQMLAERLLR